MTRMGIGDVIEHAIWVTGDESLELRNRFKDDVIKAIDDLCDEHRVNHGPVVWTEKRPGDDRVPVVPDHIQGQRVRLLVAETEVVAIRPLEKPVSFIANLDRIDLLRLRKITRKAHDKHLNGELSDAECDRIIEDCGPEAALETLRQTVRIH